MLHAVLITVGVLVTWSVIRLDERLPSPVVTGEAVMTPITALVEAPIRPMADLSLDMPVIAGPTAASPDRSIPGPVAVGPLSIGGPVTVFAGASLGGALDVVFVLDASGSMIAWLPFVIDEVERTLRGMTDEQRFAIVRFAGSRVAPTPPGRLESVTPEAVARAVSATRSAASRAMGGGSDPVPALELAIRMRPDLVLLLSEGLDGRGRFAVDRSAAIDALERLNPRDGDGDRSVRISCIRLVASEDDPPSLLLEDIARAHGDGPVHLVTPEDLDP